ncbi:MAG TPA: hypothetical protein VD699_00855 [Nitrosopumilaceae archaeon]|nr:hypothetical protein [Nitrosopumilaceae archaeon]
MKKIFSATVLAIIFASLINNYVYGAIGGYSVNLENDEWEAVVDTQVQITADLTNNQDRAQSFAYLVQIQDENGVTVSLSWITGLLEPGQFMSPSQSWTPSSLGRYTAQIFVWESVDNPDALSAPLTIKINVVETRNT